MNTQHPAETRKTWFALAALLTVSLLLRISSSLQYPLWNDELWRATLILDPGFWHGYFVSPSVETAITAPLYALLVKLAGWIQVSPPILRLTSLVPSVLCVPLAFLLIRRAGGSAALAALAGLFFAINPEFVNSAKEMKPYSLEVLVHMACLYAWLAVAMARPPTVRNWTIFFAVLVLAVFSTPTAIFILPAAGMSLFVRFAGEKSLGDIKICVVGFAVLGIIVLGLYVLEWRYGASDGMLVFWADGFFQPGQNYLHFLSSQYYGMWRLAFHTPVAVPYQALLALIVLAAVLAWMTASGWRRPEREVALFSLLLAGTLYAMNAMRLWPLGPGRENLFFLAHIILLFFLLLARFPVWRPLASLAWLCAILALLWPLRHPDGRAQYREAIAQLVSNGVPLENSDRVIEDFSTDGSVGKTIAAQCSGRKTLLLLDGFMTAASRYYIQFDAAHRRGAALLTRPCVQLVSYHEAYLEPREAETVLAQSLGDAPDAWFLYTHLGANEVVTLQRIAQRFGQVAQVKTYAGAGYFRLIIRK